MSVSTAIGSSLSSDARPSRPQRGGRVAEDACREHSAQPPALFRRPTAPVGLRPSVEAGNSVPVRGGTTRQRGPSTVGGRQSMSRPIPVAPPIPQAARDLLSDASRGLGQAMEAATVADRYAAAHLAALRAAAAVLAARARPVRGRRGSAWELISKVAPEFAEWAAFFAAGSAKRQAAEAGIHRLVSPREADDMVRQVAAFLDLVEDALTNGSGPGLRPAAGR
jgi:hypothetical protein